MPGDSLNNFEQERERLNQIVMKYSGQPVKRFFSLDAQVYRPGALSGPVKELMGLVASLVLRCDDCIKYHLIQCSKSDVSDAELEEALAIALVVGGSITIPHLRRALEFWDEAKAGGGGEPE